MLFYDSLNIFEAAISQKKAALGKNICINISLKYFAEVFIWLR